MEVVKEDVGSKEETPRLTEKQKQEDLKKFNDYKRQLREETEFIQLKNSHLQAAIDNYNLTEEYNRIQTEVANMLELRAKEEEANRSKIILPEDKKIIMP